MIKIHQALFGYSNGHHMLSSSRQLSNNSVKILELLSDLSGSEIQLGFEQYITGYPLVEDKCYALSMTWYASEMKRPGCVWTHTLLIDFSDLAFLPIDHTIENYFSRPNEVSGYNSEYYSKPILLEMPNKTINSSLCVQLNKLTPILEPLLISNKPIIIASKESKSYNFIMEFLLIKLANLFFRDISFCTGSLSNRIIEKKALDIQIVPNSIIKNITRSIKEDVQIIPEVETKENIPQWLLLFIREFINQDKCGFEDFISTFSNKYFNRKYFKSFAELYLRVKNKNSFNTVCFFDDIFELFENEDRLNITNKALSILLQTNNIENFTYPRPSIILKELSTPLEKDIVSRFDISTINDSIKKLWFTNSTELKEVFIFLISNEINSFGEQIITSLASVIESENLKELTGDSFKGSTMLISINPKLALCIELWFQPKNFQMETLSCLKYSINRSPSTLVKEISNMIFEHSNEDISEQLYYSFGDITIESFLSWAENIDDITKINMWSKLCKYNSLICIRALPQIQNLRLIQSIISTLDVSSSEILNANKNIWLNLYHSFCLNNKNDSFCNIFAQFILFIILETQEDYPKDIAYFAFSRVHKILAKNNMDYMEWEKLSNLLPEVAWYNNWDKCKRLRKAAKKMNYKFDLK